MARKHPLTEGKKNIVIALLQEYDIQSAEDIQEALKDILGGTIQSASIKFLVTAVVVA